MNISDTTIMKAMPVREENIVHLPLGLLGFERIKQFALLSSPEEAPFQWLQVLDEPTLAFLVLPTSDILPEYAPDILPEDAEFLELDSPDDALVYTIVTLHADGALKANLKGPLILNRHTLRGKQVIPADAASYAVDHHLPVHEPNEPCLTC